MSVIPDFAAMSGKQLVAAYNEYTGKDRKSQFANTSVARRAVEEAYADWLKTQPVETKPTKAAKAKPAKSAKAAKPGKGDGRIVVVAARNPHREGSFAFDHFAQAQESDTVADYLARFEEGRARKTAGQWLWNFRRWGSVRVEA